MAENQSAGATQQDRGARNAQRLGSFTVEFDEPVNRTSTINTLRLTVRGKYSLGKLGPAAANVGQMAAMPDIPGLRLRVSPRDLTAVLYDPLEKDPRLLDAINQVQKRTSPVVATSSPTTFVPSSEHKLSEDQLKTLVYELLQKHAEGMIAVVDGRFPTQEEWEQMPGRRLHDPWNTGRKARYADEVDEYERAMR